MNECSNYFKNANESTKLLAQASVELDIAMRYADESNVNNDAIDKVAEVISILAKAITFLTYEEDNEE